VITAITHTVVPENIVYDTGTVVVSYCDPLDSIFISNLFCFK